MKSYQSGLKATLAYGETLPKNYRPTMKASAVFPARYEEGKIDTTATFLGYWMLKRSIKEVTAIITLRDSFGEKVLVRSQLISSVRSFVWRVSDLLINDEFFEKTFFGSIEIEIFSARDLVFPYPAITFSYDGSYGISFVHSCGRIYNDLEDLTQNNAKSVPETGFDLIPDDNYQPFFAFVNGPVPIKSEPIGLEFVNMIGEKLLVKRSIAEVPAYGTSWVNLLENESERHFFNGQLGSVKITHNLKGFFPRFVAGNNFKNFLAVSLTHTYYDTTNDTSLEALWMNPDPKAYFDSVLTFPIDQKFQDTKLVVYPIFRQHACNLYFDFFTADGEYLFRADEVQRVADGKSAPQYIDLTGMLRKYTQNEGLALCRVIVDGQGTTPTRMKFGMNFGKIKIANELNLPANICKAAALPNAKLVDKPGTFKWCTLFNPTDQMIYLTNSGFLKEGRGNDKLIIKVWRERDGENYEWTEDIGWNCCKEILSDKRGKLGQFLGGEIGWVTINSSSPFLDGYYITDNNTGIVGGDHLY